MAVDCCSTPRTTPPAVNTNSIKRRNHGVQLRLRAIPVKAGDASRAEVPPNAWALVLPPVVTGPLCRDEICQTWDRRPILRYPTSLPDLRPCQMELCNLGRNEAR